MKTVQNLTELHQLGLASGGTVEIGGRTLNAAGEQYSPAKAPAAPVAPRSTPQPAADTGAADSAAQLSEITRLLKALPGRGWRVRVASRNELREIEELIVTPLENE